jgi:hypothetical protein
MGLLTNKIVLSGLVMLLTACAHYPNSYRSYPNNEPYYNGSSYGNYQQQEYYPRQPATGYWGNRRPYGNYRYDDNYDRPQYKNYPVPGHRRQNNKQTVQPRDYGNRPPNAGGWERRNNQPPPRRPQPVINQHNNRNSPPAIRPGHPNARRAERNEPRQDRQQPMANPSGGRFRPQFTQGQREGRHSKPGVINERMRQRPVQSGGGIKQNQRRRNQDNNS